MVIVQINKLKRFFVGYYCFNNLCREKALTSISLQVCDLSSIARVEKVSSSGGTGRLSQAPERSNRNYSSKSRPDKLTPNVQKTFTNHVKYVVPNKFRLDNGFASKIPRKNSSSSLKLKQGTTSSFDKKMILDQK